jgi:hypothetical protein
MTQHKDTRLKLGRVFLRGVPPLPGRDGPVHNCAKAADSDQDSDSVAASFGLD